MPIWEGGWQAQACGGGGGGRQAQLLHMDFQAPRRLHRLPGLPPLHTDFRALPHPLEDLALPGCAYHPCELLAREKMATIRRLADKPDNILEDPVTDRTRRSGGSILENQV
eukprot:gene13083-biopygen4998